MRLYQLIIFNYLY